jgi:hypothetical protein
VPLPLDLREQLKKHKDARLEVCPSERALLNALLSAWQRYFLVIVAADAVADQIGMYDPDVLVAHNFYGFDLDVMLHRMQELKIASWYRLGQLKKSKCVISLSLFSSLCLLDAHVRLRQDAEAADGAGFGSLVRTTQCGGWSSRVRHVPRRQGPPSQSEELLPD